MPPRADLLAPLLSLLTQSFSRTKPQVVAIDGPCASGKSTIARFVACHFGVSVIELDLFREQTTDIAYRTEDVKRIIDFRQRISRASVVEGLGCLELMSQINVVPHVTFRVKAYTESELIVHSAHAAVQSSHLDNRSTAHFEVLVPVKHLFSN